MKSRFTLFYECVLCIKYLFNNFSANMTFGNIAVFHWARQDNFLKEFTINYYSLFVTQELIATRDFRKREFYSRYTKTPNFQLLI